MALTGSFSGNYRGYTLRTEWEATQNITENYSDLEITLHLDCQSGYNLYIGQRTHTLNIAGTDYSITSSSISTGGGSSITLGSISKRLYHNNDGTLDVWLSSYCDIRARIRGTYVSGFSGGSDTISLDKIPRMSTISDNMIGSRVLGTEHTIHIEKQLSGNVTHDVWYVIRGDKGSSQWHYIAQKTSDLDLTFIPTEEHVDLQPNSSTIFMDIGCKTYKNGEQIGETTYNSGWFMKVPSKYSPDILSIDISDSNSKSKALGVYVQNHSKLKVVTNAKGLAGATIKEISVSVDKNTYSGQAITTKEITQSGNVEINIKVTDSRGKTASEKRTIKVEPYEPPKIMNFSADRIETDEKVVKLIYNFKMSSIANKNTCDWKIERRPRGTSTWTNIVSGNEKSLNTNTLTYNVSTDREYEFRLSISDFNSSNESIAYVYTIFVILDFHESGTGIAVGKSSTKPNFFENDIKMGFNKGIELEGCTKLHLFNETKPYDHENELEYFKDPFGIVHLQGIAKGTTSEWFARITREDCKPKADEIRFVPCTGFKSATLRIRKDGNILIENRSEIETNWISIGGISFKAKE
ncbi:hypothetical protein DYJ31_07840 [Parvimonas micra]|uniref:DUF859 family phage minor structural protein n=1 Tax=Parvimonas micra TaxID=33033 RepID=UPI000E4C7AA1|nr:DUF859 family phage minor structural protein [Parvimonas micra]AXU11177.1 hypothetical protein DYJ31_07840 [Parvimonas micra]